MKQQYQPPGFLDTIGSEVKQILEFGKENSDLYLLCAMNNVKFLKPHFFSSVK